METSSNFDITEEWEPCMWQWNCDVFAAIFKRYLRRWWILVTDIIVQFHVPDVSLNSHFCSCRNGSQLSGKGSFSDRCISGLTFRQAKKVTDWMFSMLNVEHGLFDATKCLRSCSVTETCYRLEQDLCSRPICRNWFPLIEWLGHLLREP